MVIRLSEISQKAKDIDPKQRINLKHRKFKTQQKVIRGKRGEREEERKEEKRGRQI